MSKIKEFSEYQVKMLKELGWKLKEGENLRRARFTVSEENRRAYYIESEKSDPEYVIHVDFVLDPSNGIDAMGVYTYLDYKAITPFGTVVNHFDEEVSKYIFTKALKNERFHDMLQSFLDSETSIIWNNQPLIFVDKTDLVTGVQKLDEALKYIRFYAKENIKIYKSLKEMADVSFEENAGIKKAGEFIISEAIRKGEHVDSIQGDLFGIASEYLEAHDDKAKAVTKIIRDSQKWFRQRFEKNLILLSFPKGGFDFMIRSKKSRCCGNRSVTIVEKTGLSVLGASCDHYRIPVERCSGKYTARKIEIIPDETGTLKNDLLEFKVEYEIPKKNKVVSLLADVPNWIMPYVDQMERKTEELNPGLDIRDIRADFRRGNYHLIELTLTCRYSEYLQDPELLLDYLRLVKETGMEIMDDFFSSDVYKYLQYTIKMKGSKVFDYSEGAETLIVHKNLHNIGIDMNKVIETVKDHVVIDYNSYEELDDDDDQIQIEPAETEMTAAEENKILQRQKEDLEYQIVELFDEIDQLKKKNRNLSTSLAASNMQIDAIKQKNAADGESEVSLYYGVPEFYDGEVKDKVLKLIGREVGQLDGNPDNKEIRRYEIFKDLLDHNEETGTAGKIYDQVQAAFNSMKSGHMTDSVMKELEAAGFEVIDGPHLKINFHGDPRYCHTLAKTASNSRSFKNALSIIKRNLLD